MLQRQTEQENPSHARDKENASNPVKMVKTPMIGAGLKMRMPGAAADGHVSPAASPNSKKMRLMRSPGKASSNLQTPILKPAGLKDITNSAVRSRTVNVHTRRTTDSVSPRLLVESNKKRSLPMLQNNPVAPPSKLHIMNTASELDFDSMPDSELPEVEVVPREAVRVESSDDDFFEQYDFSFIIDREATDDETERSEAMLAEAKKAFEVVQFESELSQLTIVEDKGTSSTVH